MTMPGRVCLVTGATSGIGQATAQALAGLGASVVILGRKDIPSAQGVQRGLEHLLGQAGQQPTSTGQLDTLPASSRHQLVGHHRQVRRQLSLRGLLLCDLCSHA
jgi:NAD(P)-dependent dehydrogenase (short-subunit alcohol dehydrogenase family)